MRICVWLIALLATPAEAKQRQLKSDIASRRFSLPLGVPRGTTASVLADFEVLQAHAKAVRRVCVSSGRALTV